MEDNKTIDRKAEYEARIRQHRIRTKAVILGSVAVIILAVVIICIVRYNSAYGSYDVKYSVRRNDTGYSRYFPFEDGYVRCSRDGIAMYSYEGNIQWEKAFEINNPAIDYNKNYIAVGNIEGNEIYLFNKEGYVSTINTALPVLQISATKNGLVAAILEDSEAVLINMYDSSGSKIYSIKSTADGDGIPVSMCASDDGRLLVAAFTGVKEQKTATSVVFYNFDEVGKNQVERIVGGYDTYGEQMVTRVKFLNDTDVVAYGENVIDFYRIEEYPQLVESVSVAGDIKKIFYSDKYAGYIYAGDGGTEFMEVYNTSGKKMISTSVLEDETQFTFTDDCVVMYGNDNVRLMNMSGKVIFNKSFEDGIDAFMQVEKDTVYLYISPDNISKIQLKHGG